MRVRTSGIGVVFTREGISLGISQRKLSRGAHVACYGIIGQTMLPKIQQDYFDDFKKIKPTRRSAWAQVFARDSEVCDGRLIPTWGHVCSLWVFLCRCVVSDAKERKGSMKSRTHFALCGEGGERLG